MAVMNAINRFMDIKCKDDQMELMLASLQKLEDIDEC
jgi:hypothetical protein